MKKCILALLVYLVGGIAWDFAGEAYAQARFRQLMMEKLTNSQKLLEALALAKYDKIVTSAEELRRLSTQAEWMGTHKSPRYEVFTNEFRRAVETMAEKAKAKNIDGVALAYVDMTMTCVRCHQFVRETRDARAKPLDVPVFLDLLDTILVNNSQEMTTL